jgi:hypothetical protein
MSVRTTISYEEENTNPEEYVSAFVVCLLLSILGLYTGEGIGGTLQDIKGRGKLIAGVKTDYPPLFFWIRMVLIKDLTLILPRPFQRNSLEARGIFCPRNHY